mgnify:CR=1 FL=1
MIYALAPEGERRREEAMKNVDKCPIWLAVIVVLVVVVCMVGFIVDISFDRELWHRSFAR